MKAAMCAMQVTHVQKFVVLGLCSNGTWIGMLLRKLLCHLLAMCCPTHCKGRQAVG